MFRSKSALAVVAAACLAMPATLLASPAFAAQTPSSKTISNVIVFSDRDDDDDDHESDDHDGHHQIPPVVIRPHHGDDHDDEGEDEDEDGGWGSSDDDENESDDDEGFTLPGPVPTPGVIAPVPGQLPNPSDPTGASVNSSNYSVNPLGASGPQGLPAGQPPIPEARGLNPEAAPPVAIQQVRGPQRTPADVFMESATFGLLAVGAGAIALGGVAGVRAIKLRRNPKGDYFYGDQN